MDDRQDQSAPVDPALPPGTEIGPYKILEQLGAGGMGVVYLAEQRKPMARRVAIKVIKPGLGSRSVLTRFEAERQALALMDHPNIARVLDAGCTDQGLPYFAMEYVPGMPLTDYCDRHKLTLEQRLELFAQVANAVQHAHQKGVIHRDLKPGNVLVRLVDGQAVPKIIDFGVAKATDHRLTAQTLYTDHGMMIGTPEYMSPEQADPTGLGVDTRTDIYSLGVLLYELLVGTLPFDAHELRRAGLLEIQRRIRDDDPVKPSTRLSSLGASSAEIARLRQAQPSQLVKRLRGELDWITMRALEKDPARRYQAASDFAEDVRKYLHGLPVDAGPPSAMYRLRRTLARHRGLVTAVGAVLVALGIGLVATLWQWRTARDEAERATVAAKDADERRAEAVAATAALRASEQQLARELERARGLRMVTAARSATATDAGLAYALAVEAASRVDRTTSSVLLRDLLAATPPEDAIQLRDAETVLPLATARYPGGHLLIGIMRDAMALWRLEDGELITREDLPGLEQAALSAGRDWTEVALEFEAELVRSPLAVGCTPFFVVALDGSTPRLALDIEGNKSEGKEATIDRLGLPLADPERSFSVHEDTLRRWAADLQQHASVPLARLPAPPAGGLVFGNTVLLVGKQYFGAWDATDGSRLWWRDPTVLRALARSADQRWIALGLESVDKAASPNAFDKVAIADEAHVRNAKWADADFDRPVQGIAFDGDHVLAVGSDGIALGLVGHRADGDISFQLLDNLETPAAAVRRIGTGFFVIANHGSVSLVQHDGKHVKVGSTLPTTPNEIPLIDHCSAGQACLLDVSTGRLLRRRWRPPASSWRQPSEVRQHASHLRFESVGAAEDGGPIGLREGSFWSGLQHKPCWSPALGQQLAAKAGSAGSLWDRFGAHAAHAHFELEFGNGNGAFFATNSGAYRGAAVSYAGDRMLGWSTRPDRVYWRRRDWVVVADLDTSDVSKCPVRVSDVHDVHAGLLVFAEGAWLICIDLDACRERWSHPIPAAPDIVRWTQATDGVVVATGKGLFCLDVESKFLRWQRTDLTDATELRTGPHGSLLVHGANRTTRILDLRTGVDLRAVKAARATVVCTAIHPDGNQIALGCTDGVALVLDVGTGQVTHEYRDLPGGVFLLGFTRDGKELVTLGKDGIFSFLPLDLVAEARQYARPLTDDERREYGIEGR